jgi:exosortase
MSTTRFSSMSANHGLSLFRTNNTPYALFGLLFATSLLVWWRPLSLTFELAIHSDQYTHILLILPVSLALILLSWNAKQDRGNPGFGIGSVLMAGALLISWMAARQLSNSPNLALAAVMFGLVLCWMGAFVLCFGIRTLRKYVFPLCLLFWLIPLPAAVLDSIVVMLQRGSALASYGLFRAFGVPVIRDGVVLSIPGIDIEVAVECSSIRSSLMLVVSSMVLAQLFLVSVWRKMSVVLLAVPLSVAKNAVRIFTLSMLGTHVDPSFLTGTLHRRGGIVFFLLALAGLVLLIRLLREPHAFIASEVSVRKSIMPTSGR